MLRKQINQTNAKLYYGCVEDDDFMQILTLETWKAYEAYDPTLGFCFSTYLKTKLMKGCRDATIGNFSKKRQHNGMEDINKQIGDFGDMTMGDVIPDEDNEQPEEAADYKLLLDIIKNELNEDEMELMNIIVDVRNYSAADYAERHGMTRQAATYRVGKLKAKLRTVVAKKYLFI